MIVTDQKCELIDSDLVYFNEMFIRNVLYTMSKQNKINF